MSFYCENCEERGEAAESEIDRLRRDLAEANSAGFNAARVAYASEFPPNAEGEPDVGSIHQNIRALKAQLAEARELLLGVRKNLRWPMPDPPKPGEDWVYDLCVRIVAFTDALAPPP
jgi:hypothetical protein